MIGTFDRDECSTRVDHLRTQLRAEGAAGAVLSSEPNVVYFIGIRFDPLWASATRSLVAVVPANGPVHLILPAFVAEEASSMWPDAVVKPYQVPPESVIPEILEVLGGLGGGAIAFEMGPESRIGFTVHEWQAITAGCGAHLIDVQRLVWSLRMRKSPTEIEALRVAAHACAAGFEEGYAGPLEGRAEEDIARGIVGAAIRGGAERVGWIGLTSGPGSYHRFVSAPRARIVEKGDLVWADVGAISGGYWTDYCRAAVVGPISDVRRDLQAAVVDATTLGISMARPGMPVAEIAAAVRARCAELGVPLIGYGRLGHGIGLSATEPPSLAEWDATTLEAGMVITVEPAVEHESGLYCTEQVVAVTNDGPDLLSIAPTSLVET